MARQLSIQFPRQKYGSHPWLLSHPFTKYQINKISKQYISFVSLFSYFRRSPFLLYIMAIFFGEVTFQICISPVYLSCYSEISLLKWKPNLGASLLKIFMVTYYIKEKKNRTNYWRLLPNTYFLMTSLLLYFSIPCLAILVHVELLPVS